jgi:putative ABC transport system permease protein
MSTLRIALEEGCKYMPFVVAAAFLFRLAHFPDVGIEGSFALGGGALAFAARHGFPISVGLLIAVTLGGLAGCLTGVLFVKFRLNSLICGVVTAFVSYSAVYYLLGRAARASIPTYVSELQVGALGVLIAFLVCVLFSLKVFLRMRMAGESPGLLARIGIEAGWRVAALLVVGNALAALGGAVAVGVLGNVNLGMGSQKLFLAINSLVLGEGVLVVLLRSGLAVRARVLGRETTPGGEVGFAWLSAALSGTGASYVMTAAVLGSFTYWLLLNVAARLFGADEYTQVVLGAATAFALVAATRFGDRLVRFSGWTFQGAIE